jgi:hypothetical protein
LRWVRSFRVQPPFEVHLIFYRYNDHELSVERLMSGRRDLARRLRDPLRELAVACREAGLVFCLYYSLPDWNHPEFPARYSQTNMKGNPNAFHGSPKPDADIKKYAAYMKGQVRCEK